MSIPEPHLNLSNWCLSSAQEKTLPFFHSPKAYTPTSFSACSTLNGPNPARWKWLAHTTTNAATATVKLSKYLACSVCVIDMFMKVNRESDSYLVFIICDPTDPLQTARFFRPMEFFR